MNSCQVLQKRHCKCQDLALGVFTLVLRKRFLTKSVSVLALIIPQVESQNAIEALLTQSADLRVSSVFLYSV